MNARWCYCAVGLLVISLPVLAEPEIYLIDNRHTFPSFEISHLGFSIQRGRFNKTRGRITLDTEAKQGGADISVETTSLDTGLEELEKELISSKWLDAMAFPAITFKSDKIIFEGEQPQRIEGIMTLHGVSKPVTLVLDHFSCGRNIVNLKYACGANATGTLKRSDFGVSNFVPMIPDEVKIIIQIEAFRQ